MIRNWQGLRYDNGANGSGALRATGARFYIEGEMGRRPGMSAVSAGTVSAAVSMTTYGDLRGNQFLVLVLANGNVQTVAV